MPKLTVNGNEVEFEQGMTVLQACEIAGEEIPRFCYHERLKIAGNCRMCLVQIEGGPPKPAASCAMPAGDGMTVHTNTPMVKKAREGVMEFLLINHPLDCPICDQGGECDLQDQAVTYGRGKSRYQEPKRGVKDKDFGPLIKPHMTRCIHCTRCVRFLNDVAGFEEFGATGRGENMEIGTFVASSVASELSGNVIDLCPVGALTSRPYAFRARSWELRHVETVDVLDAVGSNIRVDYRGKEVMRVLPRLNEDINEEWISDKTRFACDGLKSQRLDKPYVRKDGKLVPVSWDEAFDVAAEKLNSTKPEKIAAIAGDLADCESVLLLKELMNDKLSTDNIDCRQLGEDIDASNRGSYLFNSTIAGIDEADAILLIDTNPRYDAAIINARIRKRVLDANIPVGVIGDDSNFTYKANNLGQSIDTIENILSAKTEFSSVLKNAKRPMIIVGSRVMAHPDAAAIGAVLSEICKKYNVITDEWNGYNLLHRAAGRVGALDLGFVPKDKKFSVADVEAGKMDVVFLLNADELDTSKLKKSFVIYQGHHGDAGATVADVIFPAAAYTEKNATYVNTEGRVQRTKLVVFPVGEAKEDWRIIQELSEVMERSLNYTTLKSVRERMNDIAPSFSRVDDISAAKWVPFGKSGKIKKVTDTAPQVNFYMTDPISRASKTMAECVSAFVDGDSSIKEKVA